MARPLAPPAGPVKRKLVSTRSRMTASAFIFQACFCRDSFIYSSSSQRKICGALTRPMTSYDFSGRSSRRVTFVQGVDTELLRFGFFWEVEVREEV